MTPPKPNPRSVPNLLVGTPGSVPVISMADETRQSVPALMPVRRVHAVSGAPPGCPSRALHAATESPPCPPLARMAQPTKRRTGGQRRQHSLCHCIVAGADKHLARHVHEGALADPNQSTPKRCIAWLLGFGRPSVYTRLMKCACALHTASGSYTRGLGEPHR